MPMDPHTANSLIANTGLHFKTTYFETNPNEPLVLDNGKTLKYTFVETIDFLNGGHIHFDICTPKDGAYIPLNLLKTQNLVEFCPNGVIKLNDVGIPIASNDLVLAVTQHYSSSSPELININSLASFRIKKDGTTTPAYEYFLGKWIPMPMFENEVTGESASYPIGWCRVRIDKNGEAKKDGTQAFRCTWAFDTKTTDQVEEALLRPAFLPGSGNSKTYSLCNRADLLLGEFINLPDGQNDAPIGDYIASLLELDLSQTVQHKYKFIGYYVYFINFLRLIGASPVITLYNTETSKLIPVDMSVDIGNSRTCAVLFEKGDFTKARMLRLRDLSEPWNTYENAFDMRVVFRRADFGGDITLDRTLFQWPSLVRVGEEAKHLVCRSLEAPDETERCTNYSSPKRYLWDEKKFDSRWELMVIDGDPTNLKLNPQIFIEGFTEFFGNDGTFSPNKRTINLCDISTFEKQCHYSRKSLMTFVMIEMMQQALCYINSSKFRYMHGNIGQKRYLRNIIITCPTAMPLKEQHALRSAAKQATELLQKLDPTLPTMTITPDPSKLVSTDDSETLIQRGWLYDEAFASQLVYLYAELTKRYDGRVEDFLRIKGHPRKDIEDKGYTGNSLTIGTIDIGAGTTDVMITSYAQKGQNRLTPIPLFFDSFNTAGDDILRNVIRDLILEGNDSQTENLGSISSSLSHRIHSASVEDLRKIGRIKDNAYYIRQVESIERAMNEEEERCQRNHLIHDLMHHFFGDDAALMSSKDRQYRLDFCTQISHPMSQFFLELLKQGRPTKVYTYNEIFTKEKPADYILNYFEYHFGFRFETLSWRYAPEEVGNIVRDTMEPLMKALSVVMYAYNCDILVLSGRPTNLKPLTDLFLKYVPIPPHRLVLLNQYRVGRWFPLATQEGYFQESQKAVVAVGAEVGLLASTIGFNGLVLDFTELAKNMQSTARYMGIYDMNLQEVPQPFLTPQNSCATLKGISVFPCYIGCKQYNSPKYPARPLYAIYNNSGVSQLNISLQRNYYEDRELLVVEDITDNEGNDVNINSIDLHVQTIAKDGQFWMDKGAFTLKIQEI